MTSLRIFRFPTLLKLALCVAIVAIGYLTTMFYYQMRGLRESVTAIANANAIQFELEQLTTVINKNESALRSFIISRDSLYLRDHYLDRKAFDLRLQRLRKLGEDNPEFRSQVDTLEKYLDRRYEIFDNTIQTISAKNYDTNRLNYNLLQSSNFSDSLQEFINGHVNRQQYKVRKQQEFHNSKISDSRFTARILALISLFIFVLAYLKMNRDVASLRKSNAELKFLNETFNNAEKIAGFGHWKVNLETKRYTLSDNFFRMLGREPHSFEPTLENITAFIHPDDRETALGAHLESLQTQQPTSIVCRFVLDDGSVRYFRSVGSFRHNTRGQLVKIGVNYDITEQYLNTRRLSDNNQKLIKMNAELESFNSIVSHDLQEPLRKIQMFISRLEGEEKERMTPNGREFFGKIRFSAHRMQNLMIDLVNYARAIKGNKTLRETDLNLILKGVVEELALGIDEKNATVAIGELPKIEGIPLQLQQLFVNLLSNSLKYAKSDVPPIISINTEIIGQTFERDGQSVSDENFHKIVVRDNGIGFGQQYAENIFMLFRRLDTEGQYSGTGLGLAICKRIAENHSGFIQAFGEENVGAEFHLYLPK